MLVSKTRKKKDGSFKTDWRSFYLGHGLIRAEAFAARFLRWLPNVRQRDGNFFSVGPTTIGGDSNAEVLPVLTSANPVAIPADSWIAIVNKDMTADVQGRHIVVKYAFVHLATKLDPFTAWGGTAQEVKLYDLHRVVGIKEFLQLTAPHVDQDLVDHEILEAETKINEKNPQDLYNSGKAKPLGVFNAEEACEVLGMLLKGGSKELPFFPGVRKTYSQYL